MRDHPRATTTANDDNDHDDDAADADGMSRGLRIPHRLLEVHRGQKYAGTRQ
jgi:hypothetical protein